MNHMKCLILLFWIGLAFQTFGQKSYLKVAIPESAVFEIDLSFFNKNKINVEGLDPQKLRIWAGNPYMLPQEIDKTETDSIWKQIALDHNDTDHRWDARDKIRFYGQGVDEIFWNKASQCLSHRLNLYSRQNYYFIELETSTTPDLKIESSVASDSFISLDKLRKYEFTEKEIRNPLNTGRSWIGEYFINNYEIKIPSNAEKITFFGQWLSYASVDQKLYINQNNTLTSVLLPKSDFRAYDNLARYNRYGHLVNTQIEVPETTPLTIQIRPKNEEESHGAYWDYWALEYSTKPSNTGLYFFPSSQIGQRYKIREISEDMEVWDISQAFQPEKLTQHSFEKSKDLSSFFIFEKRNLPKPIFISTVSPVDLGSLEVPELLIIYPEEFEDKILEFAHYKRDERGIATLGLSIEQVYNIFGSGKKDPTAIRNAALFFFRKNSTKFKNLLLVGDANFDFKNNLNLNFSSPDVCTYQSQESLDPIYSFASDDYFGILEEHEGVWSETSGDLSTLDIGVGRLPVKNYTELETIISKVKKYEKSLRPRIQSKIAFIADNKDYNLHIRSAEALTDILIDSLPAIQVAKLYADAFVVDGQDRIPAMKEAINKVLNENVFLINYNGHGAEEGWAGEKLLTLSDILGWQDPSRQSIFLTATCEFGRFDNPNLVSGAELALIGVVGGAAALFTTTRPIYASTNNLINKAFYKNLNQNDLGSVFVLTKNQSISGVLNRNFSLLGDPSIKLPNWNDQSLENMLPDTLRLGHAKAIGLAPQNVRIRLLKPSKITQTLGQFVESPMISYNASDTVSAVFDFEKDELVSIIAPRSLTAGTTKMIYELLDDKGQTLAFGAKTVELINGDLDTEDNVGPKVEIVGTVPLQIRLTDSSGIDLGHPLSFIRIDDQPIYIQEFIVDKATTKEVTLIESKIGVKGLHRIDAKFYDSNNNPSEISLVYEAGLEKWAISKSQISPNPIERLANLIVQTNRSEDEVNIELFFMDAAGKQLGKLQKHVIFSETLWKIGLDFDDFYLPQGKVFYFCVLKSKRFRDRVTSSGTLWFWK